MNRQTFSFALLVSASLVCLASSPTVSAQQSDQYQGVSKPPAEQITAMPDTPLPKPSPALVAAPPPSQAEAPLPDQSAGETASSTDAISAVPPLATRAQSSDPDGDIVQPRQARPGELLSGATLQVRLLDRLSSSDSEKGESFHGEVAFDVLQDGQMLIPAGSKIEGKVVSVSTGHLGGHGSMRLKPESLILPSGVRFDLHAEATGTQGSKTRMGSEGAINPGSRATRDGVEYGAVVGAGATTGAIMGGPAGELAGGLIGAGVVTTHLMVDHPQTNLEAGSIVFFTLTDSLEMSSQSEN